ncbi:ABC transporter substrate-binding protein [bacterium]|nr:ABC transporter substrate-binding protein [bacterium]
MFNRLKTLFLITAAATIAATTAFADANEIKFNRKLKQATTQPLLYKIGDLLPVIAAKHGIKDLKVTYVDIADDTVANQEMLVGNIDVNYGGIGTFAYIWDKDPTKVKVISGVQTLENWLVCANPSIKTMNDIKADTKIAMKAINGGDHIVLREYAMAAYGPKESEKLNSNIVVMARDAILATMSTEKPTVDCAILGSPGQNILTKNGKAHVVAKPDNKVSFGYPTALYATTKWLEANPKLAQALFEAEVEAIKAYEKEPLPIIEEYIKRDNIPNVTAKEVYDMKVENRDVYDTSLIPGFATVQIMIDSGVLTGPNKKIGADAIYNRSWVKH